MVKIHARPTKITYAILCLCLAGMVIHVFIDSAGDFPLGQFSARNSILNAAQCQSHSHEDNFLLPALPTEVKPVLLISQFSDRESMKRSHPPDPLMHPPTAS